MITVDQALERLFALAGAMPCEDVPLLRAQGRVLARDAVARRDQPPFAASAMDGYAVVSAQPGQRLRVIGESAAGHRFGGAVGPHEAVRIFTGAPVPPGATRIIIQEDVQRDGDTIVLGDRLDAGPYLRPAGNDFRAGQTVAAGRRLTPNDIALLASMNIAQVSVHRRPVIALIATGDELVMPGEAPNPDQIIASNTFGLHALMQTLGAEARMLPIARDTPASLETVLGLAAEANLVITVGGASVGDHDLVAQVAAGLGMERAFYKVAMRPGKPLMAGRLGNAMMIGLPGNPVSAMVCGHVFVAPVVRGMLGLPLKPAPRLRAPLATALPANGAREHYMRASLGAEGLSAFARQDSALLSVLGQSDALLVRPVGDIMRTAGEMMDYIAL